MGDGSFRVRPKKGKGVELISGETQGLKGGLDEGEGDKRGGLGREDGYSKPGAPLPAFPVYLPQHFNGKIRETVLERDKSWRNNT
jgi:hypothetical protein